MRLWQLRNMSMYRVLWEPWRKMTHFTWKILKHFSEEVLVNLEFKG